MRFLAIGEAMVELSGAPEGEGLWRLGYAGDTLNTAWYARALLPDSWQVGYVTKLGGDSFSARMQAFLTANALDTSHITIDPAKSVGLYAIELVEGERHFSYWRGQSAAKGLADDPAALGAALADGDALYFSGITLAILPPAGRRALLAALASARAAGKVTIFDPNLRPRLWDSATEMRDSVMEAARAAAIVMPSFDDEAATFGDADLAACAARWRAAGAGEVIVKNGGGPMLAVDDSGARDIAVTRITPVDTTGAGDSFNGGYLAARLQGADMVSAALAGHFVSSQVIGHRGALMPMAAVKAPQASGMADKGTTAEK